MNIRQLETLYWATRLGSLIAAADKLNSTQSTVSMRIQELESEFGIVLFDRSQRTARVTAKGREMARYAEEILSLISKMQETLAAPEALPGFIRIGVAEMVSVSWLPDFITSLRSQFPKFSIEIEEALTGDLAQGLEAGSLDIIFVAGRVSGRDSTTYPLGVVPMSWAAAPSIELPDEPLTAGDLERFPIIALSRESNHYDKIESWFTSGNARFRRPFTCKSFSVCLQLATAGLGITLVSPTYFPQPFVEGRLRAFKTSPPFPPVEFNAVYRDKNLNAAAPVICKLAQATSTFDKT
jgi:DNA-binding transcriptional LysR family regulator